MIRTEMISKYYGDFKALDDVSININKGSIYGLVGPNGAGKTTLLKILTGVYRQDRGYIVIDEQPVEDNESLKQRICFIPDELYYYPTATVKGMATFYEEMYEVFDKDRFNKIQSILNISLNKRIGQLSKGMKKQVAFWLGICTMPDVMILDEPVDGLDPVMRKQVWSLLLQDVAEREMTVLVSSHNLRELEDVCDCVGFLHKGKVLLERDLDEMKTDIHKVQVSFKEKEVSLGELEPLKESHLGSVRTVIVRGSRETIEAKLAVYHPILVDFIPLTLEEIFVYEIGEQGYEVKNIIL